MAILRTFFDRKSASPGSGVGSGRTRRVDTIRERILALAAATPAGQERKQAAIAAIPGRAATRRAMRVYYGQGKNRFSHWAKLLSARRRLARTVRAVLVGRGWRALPRGQADMNILRSALEGADAPATDEAI